MEWCVVVDKIPNVNVIVVDVISRLALNFVCFDCLFDSSSSSSIYHVFKRSYTPFGISI